jgi:hypothetical protein
MEAISATQPRITAAFGFEAQRLAAPRDGFVHTAVDVLAGGGWKVPG